VCPPQSGAMKKVQSFAEDIPVFGTGGMRKAQQTKRVDAVRNLLRQYGAEDLAEAEDDVMKDLLSKRETDISKYTKAKEEVIEKLSAKTPQVLGEKGASIGVAKAVQVTNAVKKIDEQISELSAMRLDEMKPVIDRLKNWRSAIENQDFKTLVADQKQIGESFKAQGLEGVRNRAEKSLSSIYGKIDENGKPIDGLAKDITDYIKQNGGEYDVNKWMAANKQLSNMMGELEMTALKSALEKGERSPEMIKKLLYSKNRSDVAALYKNLNPQGQARAKAAIIAKAAETATGDVSAETFSRNVKKMGAQTGVFFNEEDAKKVNGLVKVIDATNRASQSAVNPPTGARVLMPASYAAIATLIPGSPLERFVGATSAMALAGGAANLYESKPVRDLLIRISQAKIGSEQEAALIRRVLEVSRAQKATQGAKNGD